MPDDTPFWHTWLKQTRSFALVIAVGLAELAIGTEGQVTYALIAVWLLLVAAGLGPIQYSVSLAIVLITTSQFAQQSRSPLACPMGAAAGSQASTVHSPSRP